MNREGSASTPDRRRPRRVYGHGAEPDPRFSLANERTFLAWLRTALALVAAGVALHALGVPADPFWRTVAALLFIALGALAVVRGWLGWTSTEVALRLGRPLPSLAVGVVLMVGIVLGSVVVAVGVLV